jgi:dolichol-phosphate mannosyltransferase
VTELGPVWVCVPTYDEAENVERLVRAVTRELWDARLDGHVLVIDDDSPDGTGRIADRLAAEDSRVHVLHRTERAGIGPAYIAGFRRALAMGAGLVVEMDCDLSHDPASLPALIRAAADHDLVLGSRYVAGGRVARWGLLRRLISRGGCWYARTALGVPVRDLTGGFKCFRREVLLALPLDRVRASGYGFQIEMTYRALERGFRVTEVPITFTERTAGTSKMSAGIALEAAAMVARLRLGRSRRPEAARPEDPALTRPVA